MPVDTKSLLRLASPCLDSRGRHTRNSEVSEKRDPQGEVSLDYVDYWFLNGLDSGPLTYQPGAPGGADQSL